MKKVMKSIEQLIFLDNFLEGKSVPSQLLAWLYIEEMDDLYFLYYDNNNDDELQRIYRLIDKHKKEK